MIRPVLPARGRRTARWAAAAVASATALSIAGTGAPAVSAVPSDNPCPAAVPVSELAAGQLVDGQTVSSGTRPDPFSGKVLGVLKNGISLGVDMIMVELTSAEIDDVGGIWSGMSGSPVYAADGRLIGAVSYGLAVGPSPVAGVTPAADMQRLLSAAPSAPVPAGARQVEIPARLGDRLVRDQVATDAEVDSGLSRLRLPLSVTGVGAERAGLVAKAFGRKPSEVMAAGSASLAPAEQAMVPGGNLAAAISYGDVTAAAVGTVTAVCGSEVLGFGHPMMWRGPTSLSLHAADTIYVQKDPTVAPFKVANIDPSPIGTVTQDRMAGILGVTGAGPATSDITSSVSFDGGQPRAGATHVTLADWVPDLAFSHLLANEDAVFDGYGKGGAAMGWTISGTRADGRTWSLTRGDRVASPYDVTFESAFDLVDALYTLQQNGFEQVTVDAVDVDSALTRDYDTYTFKQAQIRQGTKWVTLTRKSRLQLPAGRRQFFRITVDSDHHGEQRFIRPVRVPRSGVGREGLLQISGGNDFSGNSSYYGSDEYYFEEGGYSEDSNKSFDDVLEQIGSQPRNDDVVVDLRFFSRNGRVVEEVQRRHRTDLVVSGGLSLPVLVLG
ncbi:hypothetical protein [Nocardioides mesophilus]|uniref:Peptidase S55 domain-containing protein n=1 Tax=Nocardioides mesophilus TaxID=433659 RepID=A0A7G9RCG1_9ACTN|nr:hypothetical protein [Nocardioides mesophilus]QNN53286.1 hypothetical protein H9L09_02045 [Nocardioides mesophilus]